MNQGICLCLIALSFCSIIFEVKSHGMLIDPVGRSSRWRFNNSAPKNYDDDQVYCGGFGV